MYLVSGDCLALKTVFRDLPSANVSALDIVTKIPIHTSLPQWRMGLESIALESL